MQCRTFFQELSSTKLWVCVKFHHNSTGKMYVMDEISLECEMSLGNVSHITNSNNKVYETERNSANGVYPFYVILIPTSPVFSLISTTVSQQCTRLSDFQFVLRPVTSSPGFGQCDVISGVCDAFNICLNGAGLRAILTLLLFSEGTSSWKKRYESNMDYLLSKLPRVLRTGVRCNKLL